jgi:hypothetical protein
MNGIQLTLGIIAFCGTVLPALSQERFPASSVDFDVSKIAFGRSTNTFARPLLFDKDGNFFLYIQETSSMRSAILKGRINKPGIAVVAELSHTELLPSYSDCRMAISSGTLAWISSRSKICFCRDLEKFDKAIEVKFELRGEPVMLLPSDEGRFHLLQLSKEKLSAQEFDPVSQKFLDERVVYKTIDGIRTIVAIDSGLIAVVERRIERKYRTSLVDVSGKGELHTAHLRYPISCAAEVDKGKFVYGLENGFLCTVEWESGDYRTFDIGLKRTVSSMQLSRQEKCLIVSSLDIGTVNLAIVGLKDFELIRSYRAPWCPQLCEFTTSGKEMLSISGDGNLRIFDTIKFLRQEKGDNQH